MTSRDDTQPHDSAGDRLTNLEEKHAYAERTIEDLSGEIIVLHERLSSAMARLDRLEHNLDRLTWTLSQGNISDQQDTTQDPDTDASASPTE